jgi:hypothetical protein
MLISFLGFAWAKPVAAELSNSAGMLSVSNATVWIPGKLGQQEVTYYVDTVAFVLLFVALIRPSSGEFSEEASTPAKAKSVSLSSSLSRQTTMED